VAVRNGFAWILVLILLVPTAAPLEAQLRPLPPYDRSLLEGARMFAVEVGVGVYDDQLASLAGTRGRLIEVGTIEVAWRLDRIILEAGGTILRWFRDESTFAAPVGGARPSDDGRRVDVGDFRIATIIPLISRQAGGFLLRFGTRLPTTDNGVGLERDQTDFFALLGGNLARGTWSFSAESGLGIHGTRDEDDEQYDVLLYSVTTRYRKGVAVAHLAVLGQEGGRDWWTRGNEDLHEARLGVRFGERRWVGAQVVRGLGRFSPDVGLTLTAGAKL